MPGLADRRTLQQLLESGETVFSLTGLPLHGVLLTPDDATDVVTSGYLRADAAGTVTAVPHAGDKTTTIVCTLAAGEFFPCMVRRVYSTGTSATPLHLFY